MKTNFYTAALIAIIAIACSISLICKDRLSDDYQSIDGYYQAAIVTTDSGWVQKEGYLENALQIGKITYFRYSNDGQYLFTFGGDYTFRKWDVKTGMVVKEKKFEDIYKFRFDLHSDDETFAIINTYNYSSDLEIYKNDSLIYKLDVFDLYSIEDYCYYENILINFLKDKHQININYDCTCYSSRINETEGSNFIVEFDSSKVVHEDYYNGNATNLTVSKNAKYLLYSKYSYRYDEYDDYDFRYYYYLILKDLENNSVNSINRNENDKPYHSIAFSNNSKYLVSTMYDSYTLVWDIDNQKTKYRIYIPNLMNNQFSTDDRFLISTLEKPDISIIKFFLADSGVEADSIAYQGNIGLIAVSPDSVSIAIAGSDGRIRIFQPKIFNKQFFASFTSDTLIKQLGEPIYFTDNSLENPSSWLWDFGDGTTSTEQHPVHFYNTKGLFSVRLIASNGTQIDTLTRKDFIRIVIPVLAKFDSNITQDTVPLNVQFINQSKGDIKNYNWTFSNKKTSQVENPEILFDKWGEYDVSLKVTDDYFSDSVFVSEKIKVIPPAIPFFTNKLEKRFVQNNQTYYGIDGIQTYDGNFVFIAKVFDVETYYYDDEFHYIEKYRNKLLIKMDSVGNVIWEVVSDSISKIIKTVDSCYLTIGNCTAPRNLFTIKKYNRNFELMWEKTYDNNGNEIAMDGCIDEDGGILIIGCSQLNRPYKTVVLKLDKEGNQLWHKTFGGIGGTVISTKDKNNLFIIDYADKHQIILIKLNEKGNDIWQKSVGENVYPKNSMLLNNNNILISGYKGNKDNSIKYNSYLVKVDSSGNKIWEYIGDSPNSCYYSICSISDTLFAASGNFNNQLGVDIINNHGELVNSVRFPERNGVINSIITTKDNNLFLTGSITPPYKLSQLYTLLLKHPYTITSVEDEQTENIANPEQPFSIFPNPTNSTATLQYTIDTPTLVKIELIDFMGMKVSELENAFKEAGNYSTFINFEGLTIAKGMYFVRFITNGNVFVSKIIFC